MTANIVLGWFFWKNCFQALLAKNVVFRKISKDLLTKITAFFKKLSLRTSWPEILNFIGIFSEGTFQTKISRKKINTIFLNINFNIRWFLIIYLQELSGKRSNRGVSNKMFERTKNVKFRTKVLKDQKSCISIISNF